MQLTAIHVECNNGQKADEMPRRLLLGDHWLDIQEVLDRWYQAESKPEWPRANYLKVHGADQHDYLLKHDLESGEWYLGRCW
jgi:hypothetical protein